MPLTSVRRINFSAFKDSATLPATKSALIFKHRDFLSSPIGEITGIISFEIRFFISLVLILLTFPTRPKSNPDSPINFDALTIFEFVKFKPFERAPDFEMRVDISSLTLISSIPLD